MISLVLAAALGAVTFLEQDIPGLDAGRVNPWTGGVTTNFRHADLDGDGAPDLVLPDSVCFQRDGSFLRENRAPIPHAGDSPRCDLWPGQLFLWLDGRLTVVERHEDNWRTVLEHDLEWPGSDPPGPLPGAENPGVCFQRFLEDLDEDGVPELVAPSPEGIHVFASNDGRYAETICLDVFPPLSFSGMSRQPLWPPEQRTVLLPTRQMTCRFFIDNRHVVVISRDHLPTGFVRFRTVSHTLSDTRPFDLLPGQSEEHVTEPLPAFLEPCRLNNDGRIDYAGGSWHVSKSSVAPVPVFETHVSTNGGASCDVVRTRSFRPLCSFLDVNGDGRLDLVAESTGLFEGGSRETLNRFLTDRRIDHEVRIHYQGVSGGFSKSADVRGRFTLTMESVPARNGGMFRRYQAGELVNMTGDFNGDGFRDTLVRDRSDRLVLFLLRDGEFPARPAGDLEIQPEWQFAVTDVDGDGRSDVVIRGIDPVDRNGLGQTRVYLTREGTG